MYTGLRGLRELDKTTAFNLEGRNPKLCSEECEGWVPAARAPTQDVHPQSAGCFLSTPSFLVVSASFFIFLLCQVNILKDGLTLPQVVYLDIQMIFPGIDDWLFLRK